MSWNATISGLLDDISVSAALAVSGWPVVGPLKIALALFAALLGVSALSCSSARTGGEVGDDSGGGEVDDAGGEVDSGDGDVSTSDLVRVELGEAVQIRSLNVLSGDTAFLGIGNQRGVELALDDYGDLKGFPVDLGVGVDGLCSSDGGQAAAQSIVADERVVGVVGPSCSATATAAAPLITAAGMVMIAPSNTSPALTSDLAGNPGMNRSDGYFRTAHNDLFQGKAVAEFLYNRQGFRTAAAIHDGDPFTHGLASAFKDAFESLGGSVSCICRINKDDSDIVPVLTEIATKQPEALFFPVFRPAGDFIADQARTVPGLETTRLVSAPSLGDDFLSLPQSAGMFLSGPDTRLGTNTNQATGVTAATVFDDYTDRYGEEPVSPYWAHSYDATTMLLDAIVAASTVDDDGALLIDREGVRRALHATSGYSGLIGTLSCDDFGDCGTQRLVIIEHTDPDTPAVSKENIVFEFAP